jgi:hypothetical protein
MNTCPDLLAALHTRMRDLELEACDVKARVSELRDVIDRLERPQRRGRPRKPEVVHDATALLRDQLTHTDTDDDELPSQSDTPGA